MNNNADAYGAKLAAMVGEDFYKFDIRDCLPSTNTELIRLAGQGAPEGTVLIARRQTAGRGQVGRSFFSPEDTGIYMSLLLRPGFSFADSITATACAAVVAAHSLQMVSRKKIQLKWVNDVFADGKKMAGILTETAFNKDKSLRFLVIGFGINVYRPEAGFPAELSKTAGSALDERTDEDIRPLLVQNILAELLRCYRAGMKPGGIIDEYRRLSMVVGRRINIHLKDTIMPALAVSVNDDFSLRVRLDDGNEQSLRYGEVSVRLDS